MNVLNNCQDNNHEMVALPFNNWSPWKAVMNVDYILCWYTLLNADVTSTKKNLSVVLKVVQRWLEGSSGSLINEELFQKPSLTHVFILL